MKMLGAAVLVWAFLLGAGCAGPKGPAFRPEVIEPARAVIYVYRPPRSWAGRAVGVSIDQREVGRLDAGQHLAVQVDPGEHVIRVEGSSDAVREVRLIEGDSAFLEVRASAWDERPAITLLDEEAARRRIAHTGRADAPR
jgi:hypothetical protein